MSDELIRKATKFAAKAHGSAEQLRKYTFDPYIVHPWAVYNTLRHYKVPVEVLAAALLHDVVEDCKVTLEEIEREFGTRVRELVDWCTDPFTKAAYPEWNRKKRVQAYTDKLAGIPADAVMIKLADFSDNIASEVQFDPELAALHISEKRLALPHYRKAMEGQSDAYRGLFAAVESVLDGGVKAFP